MASEIQSRRVLWEEKMAIEPDLGDQRQSVYKALPSPPKTPKRVMKQYRFSGIFPLLLSLASFVLSLIVVLAGQNAGRFEGHYLVALNTSRIGQDVITFERARTTSDAPTAASSVGPSPLDLATSLPTSSAPDAASPDDLLSGFGDLLGNMSGNLTDAINDGLGQGLNKVVKGVVEQMGVVDMYYVYLESVCGARLVGSGNAGGVEIEDCRSWEDAGDGLSALSKKMGSSLVVGQSRVSVPLLAKLVSSLHGVLDSAGAIRRAIFAFVVMTLVGSMLSAVSMLPAVYFPQSRLLVYMNMVWPGVAAVFAFVAATALSAIVVLAGAVEGFSGTVGVGIRQGGTVVLFAWLSFACAGMAALYWASVWFVETRRSSFVRRRRDQDELGQWRGIGREVWRDLRGRRRQPSVRADT